MLIGSANLAFEKRFKIESQNLCRLFLNKNEKLIKNHPLKRSFQSSSAFVEKLVEIYCRRGNSFLANNPCYTKTIDITDCRKIGKGQRKCIELADWPEI